MRGRKDSETTESGQITAERSALFLLTNCPTSPFLGYLALYDRRESTGNEEGGSFVARLGNSRRCLEVTVPIDKIGAAFPDELSRFDMLSRHEVNERFAIADTQAIWRCRATVGMR